MKWILALTVINLPMACCQQLFCIALIDTASETAPKSSTHRLAVRGGMAKKINVMLL